MHLPTEPLPREPLNGLIQLAHSREGLFEEMDLDYETCFRDAERITFKCYDRAGDIIYIRMKPTVVEEAVFGDLSQEVSHDPGR